LNDQTGTPTWRRPSKAAAEQAITPDHIMQIGSGFWASKTPLSAVELGVFTS
jgi:hypothetical protein